MKKRLFPLLIALSALLVSGSAAFYSVFGLSKLFAGASTQVIIMAGSLEFAKLVVASLLYQYWDTINKWLRSYLTIACFVLMIITSGGIYGFLSGAYQSTATQSELLDKSLLILNQKQVRFEETKKDLTLEKTQINKSISDLRVSLSNPQQVSWYDKNSETVITSTSSSARRALQTELKTTITDRDNINLKLEAVLDSINKTDMVLLEKEISNESESELGPLKYLASTTGWSMDRVVNYFLLLIVFVFDPLAIALVVAANMSFAQLKKPEIDFDLYNPPLPNDKLKNIAEKYKEIKIEKEDVVMDDLEDLQDYINYTREEPVDNLTYPNIIRSIPTHDPQTGELNADYKELTGKENPLEEDTSRLTDTTKTLIVENNLSDDEKHIEEAVKSFMEDDLVDEWLEELGKEKGLKSKEKDLPLTKILRYTKRQ